MANNSNMRTAWKKYQCRRDLMQRISFGDDSILVAPGTEEAWQALYSVMAAHGYHIRLDDTDSYNCRNIKGTKTRSLHAFGIALDVNWHTNPWRDHAGRRAVKYSERDTQEARAVDVKHGRADTDMTPEMIAAVNAIRTRNGQQVFEWGGDWNTVKDAMHFEIALTPKELGAGIDWNTVEQPDHNVASIIKDDPVHDEGPASGLPAIVEGKSPSYLVIGDKGPLVKALQTSLTSLGSWLGAIDGIFGKMTRDALLAFQADNELTATGVYDAATLTAMETAQPRPISRDRIGADEQELIARGSQTAKSTRWNRWLGLGTIALGLFGLSDKHINFIQGAANILREGVGTIETSTLPKEFAQTALERLLRDNPNATPEQIEKLATEIAAAFQDGMAVQPNESTGGLIDSALSLGQGLLSANGFGIWPLIAGAGFMIWRNAKNASARRLEDHRTGANRAR